MKIKNECKHIIDVAEFLVMTNFFSENSLILEIVTQNKTVARRVWAQIGFPFPPRGFENRTLLENFDSVTTYCAKRHTCSVEPCQPLNQFSIDISHI